ncbi:MAG TPA: phosphotransferase, partial [Dongiaceae bacterium]|nr:phosphotransferase [Dongiaceae bacterium]
MAVYTEVPDNELRAFIEQYEIGEVVSCKGIAEGVENSNFLLHTATGAYILTLYEKRVKLEDLPFFLGLMQHLAKKGLSCPTPLNGKDGNPLRELCGRPAAICSFLEGMWPRRPNERHCQLLGAALADLHVKGRDFPLQRPNNLSLAGWRELAAKTEARADEVEAGLGALIADELLYLDRQWPREL